ncbi:hypothetical protein BYT27DRAFT_7211747 [Phlegmacium glaucopus]|nr:hypothetical protein BYT27DRAFT_7211747 [Phlegmacium glaucopus]
MTPAPETTSSPVVDPTDAAKPIVHVWNISTHISGENLDRTKANWKKWSTTMRQSLNVSALGHHIDPARNHPPDALTCPTSYDNWLTNNLAVRAFLEMHCSDFEQEFIEKYSTALDSLEALKAAHLTEGPVKQMELIHMVFTTRIPRNKDQDAKVQQITEDIGRAFNMPGGLSKDTL